MIVFQSNVAEWWQKVGAVTVLLQNAEHMQIKM